MPRAPPSGGPRRSPRSTSSPGVLPGCSGRAPVLGPWGFGVGRGRCGDGPGLPGREGAGPAGPRLLRRIRPGDLDELGPLVPDLRAHPGRGVAVLHGAGDLAERLPAALRT